ncbi:ACT domain-containing protein acr8 [Dionaea muscipula]
MMDVQVQMWSEEFEKLIFRTTTPSVKIDNAVCPTTTVVKVDSARKHGILLEAVQVLTDLNLSIKKAYISSDGRWFMDVFHVTDLNGNKLTDESVITYMEQSLGSIHYLRNESVRHNGLTALELTGTDRIGLLSEVFAVLSDLQCNVVDAKVWTHNGRIASLIYVKDCDSGSQIEDCKRIERIESMLKPVLKGDNDIKGTAKTSVSMAVTHNERRLHQMMYADQMLFAVRRSNANAIPVKSDSPVVTVENWALFCYSVVKVQCKDRSKLLFDVVCTVTDMGYIVFHATVNTEEEAGVAFLEFYIRHTDGTPISSDAEMDRVRQCIEASIERRDSRGVRLELSTKDRPGLLADVTRTFRENGLNITTAEISTSGNTALNIFHVTDAEGSTPSAKTIESVREKIGPSNLKVKELPTSCGHRKAERDRPIAGTGGTTTTMLLSLGNIVRRNLYNLGLIKSFS